MNKSIGLKKLLAASCVTLAVALASTPSWAARLDVWALKLGTAVADMPAPDEFMAYSCGSNGGPPLKPLTWWDGFAECKPEADGLYEVYFEYDDEDEYIYRATEDVRIGRFAGTSDKSFPIITSALFSRDGILSGIRIITDPRPDSERDVEFSNLRPRDEHYLLGAYLASQFKIDVATHCVKLPLGDRESAVGNVYVKQDCERTDAEAGVHYFISQRYFRKAGQNDRDPHTGALTKGQYESTTRAEIRLISKD